MRRIAPRLARGVLVAAAVTPLVAGCGSPDTAAYCAALKAADAQWSQAGASLEDKAAATSFVATVKTVELTAPDEVKSEWASLQTLFEKFATDAPDLTEVAPELKDFEDAAQRIEAHAKETCDIDLGQ
jgi:ABC-type glycerol-3-phosphate transport system substrate-binding protein